MSKKLAFIAGVVSAFAAALFIYLSITGEEKSEPEFSPFADELPEQSREVADTGLAVPTATQMRRARTKLEQETREKIERSREMDERDDSEPDDTLNRIGPTGDDALARKPTTEDTTAAGADDAPAAGSLDKETIRDGIKAVTPMVKECYESSLEDFPDAKGKVTVGFRIIGEDGEGRVELSELDDERTTLFDERLHDCMLKSIGEATFDVPPEGGVVNVTYPFQFDNDGSGEQDDE